MLTEFDKNEFFHEMKVIKRKLFLNEILDKQFYNFLQGNPLEWTFFNKGTKEILYKEDCNKVFPFLYMETASDQQYFISNIKSFIVRNILPESSKGKSFRISIFYKDSIILDLKRCSFCNARIPSRFYICPFCGFDSVNLLSSIKESNAIKWTTIKNI